MSEPGAGEEFTVRKAVDGDIPSLEELIPLSARALQASFYSGAQIEAALGPVFAVDRQLIRDGTYFVVEVNGKVVGCGGWSRRLAVFGGDATRAKMTGELNPGRDPARIRAFFVDPARARRGIGRLLLRACEEALCAAGFREAVLVATLAGERLYARAGYSVLERYDVSLSAELKLPVVRMGKRFGGHLEEKGTTREV